MGRLQDRVVFITGASSGFGAACARAFAGEKSRLLLAARRIDRLEGMIPALKEAGAAEVRTIERNVRDREAVNAAVAALPDPWKEIEVLVNNAGLSRGLDKLHEGNPSDWEEMIDTNVKGLLWVDRAVVPLMVIWSLAVRATVSSPRNRSISARCSSASSCRGGSSLACSSRNSISVRVKSTIIYSSSYTKHLLKED